MVTRQAKLQFEPVAEYPSPAGGGIVARGKLGIDNVDHRQNHQRRTCETRVHRTSSKGGVRLHFYFESGEAADWLDRTVNVPTVNSLTLAEWIVEFERLKKVNAEIIGGKGGKAAPKGKKAR